MNIFTRSDYAPKNVSVISTPEERVERISAIRLQEDLSFVQAAGLNRHDLKLEEPRLIGHQAFDLINLEAAVARTSERLIPFLIDFLPSGGYSREVNLYCPAGIGGHRDHLSTLLAVRGAFDKLRSRSAIHLYEDLHYASVPQARETGLKRVAQIFPGAVLSSTVHTLNAKEAENKMHLIGLYASQHREAPQSAKFVPASGLTPALHEIIWHVT